MLPGFAEGSWHTNLLQRPLLRKGYAAAPDARSADIIVTHSGGCFYLSEVREDAIIICIDPPYWPGRSVVVRSANKLAGDFITAARRGKLGFWARKHLWNCIYIGANLLRVFQMAHFASRKDFHQALRDRQVSIIRNDDDAWFSPDAEQTLPPNKRLKVYSIPGQHEDCWVYTEEHAALIDEIIKEMVAERSEA
jgi:hypothetical protein